MYYMTSKVYNFEKQEWFIILFKISQSMKFAIQSQYNYSLSFLDPSCETKGELLAQ